MIGREWVRTPQNRADHVTGVSTAGLPKRPSARRPRSSSAARLARRNDGRKGACGAFRLGVAAASILFPSSKAIVGRYTDDEGTFAGGPLGPIRKSVVSTLFVRKGDSLPIRPSFVPHSDTRMVRSLLKQRLGTTTWKKNRWHGSGSGACSEAVYSLPVCTRWRSLKPCARHGERSILREAPQGRSDKMR